MINQPSRYTLEMLSEQGMEGAEWCIYDNTKSGYEGLISLSNGMKINIIGKWQGVIKKNRDSHRRWFYKCKSYVEKGDFRGLLISRGYSTIEMSNEECEELARRNMTQQVAKGYWCHWLQEGVDPDEWAQWFLDELPVEIL